MILHLLYGLALRVWHFPGDALAARQEEARFRRFVKRWEAAGRPYDLDEVPPVDSRPR